MFLSIEWHPLYQLAIQLLAMRLNIQATGYGLR
ncbi:MAG: hypothetical protein RL650_2005 [Pseudomonadota bacterium]|jgi:hypothetical protein